MSNAAFDPSALPGDNPVAQSQTLTVTLNATQAGVAWSVRGLARTLAAVQGTALLLGAARALNLALACAVSTLTTVAGIKNRRLAQALSLAAASAPSLAKGRGLKRTLSVAAASVPSLARRAARVLLLGTTQAAAPALGGTRHLLRLLSAAQSSAGSQRRALGRTLTLSAPSLPVLTRAFGMRLTAQAGAFCLLAAPGLVALFADPFLTMRLFLLSLLTLRPKMINLAKLLSILDTVGSSYRVADLQSTTTTLTNVPAQIYGDGNTVYGTGNEPFILKMAASVDAMIAAASPDVVNKAIYGLFFQPLNSFLSQQGAASGGGYTNLDTYLTTLNTGQAGAAYSALVSPNTAYLQWLYASKQPTLLMQPTNVYAPVTALGTATVGAGAALALTVTAGIPTVNDTVDGVQGFAPAPGVSAVVTNAIGGTLTVTLTASGWSAQGQPVTGRTWTATLDNKAAGQVIAFVPQAAGDRISLATALAGQGTAGSGAFNLQSVPDRSAP